MHPVLTPLSVQTDLLPGLLLAHRMRDRDYLMSLQTDNLLLAYRHEAGLFATTARLTDCHWGWDGPLSDLRGMFTGHWLSAAARILQKTEDAALRAKADFIVAEIARCQQENGGEWGFPIPEKHLHWLKRGKHTWAPQYVCHKCMMGLLDMYRYAGNEQALAIVLKEADWFLRFTDDIPRELMDDMMDWEETGGIMEYWADLYAVTGDANHLTLMRRYERPRLFEPLLGGVDVLTNMHANTTIPEIHGAARAYEVTGEERYRRIAEAYWEQAVTRRGMYATGGQTCGEIWTPPHRQAARLSARNQEHCVVYNMMRLAEYLLRWTGKAEYADYWERNLINGILAQTFWREDRNPVLCCDDPTPDEGIVAYYLGLAAGSRITWGSRTDHFWCCHCTAVQSNAMLHDGIFYRDAQGLRICQYAPATLSGEHGGVAFTVSQTLDHRSGTGLASSPIQWEVPARPEDIRLRVEIKADAPLAMALRIRKPWWLAGEAVIIRNGETVPLTEDEGYFVVDGTWQDDTLTITLPKRLTAWPLADDESTVAFLDGPVVLAGLCADERMLYGDRDDPYTMLTPDNERQWQEWLPYWKTKNQPSGIRFVPINEVGKETYTVYFPVRSKDEWCHWTKRSESGQ